MRQLDRALLRDGAAYVDRWLAYQQERRDIPGLVAAIRHGDDLLLSTAYGCADLERGTAMTPGHIFRIASHSKTFTATAIMQLVDREVLRLDDRLAAYIHWLGQHSGLARVTLRQALNHTSGIIRDGADTLTSRRRGHAAHRRDQWLRRSGRNAALRVRRRGTSRESHPGRTQPLPTRRLPRAGTGRVIVSRADA